MEVTFFDFWDTWYTSKHLAIGKDSGGAGKCNSFIFFEAEIAEKVKGQIDL